MAVIRAIGTAVPPYIYSQDQVTQLVQEIFSAVTNLDRYLSIFQNTGIKKRNFSVPPDWFQTEPSLAEKNELYIEHAITLSEQAIEKCLQQTDISIHQIDHLIFISSTGISTPSIDAYLINRLGLAPHCKRTPIWGLGCAGGAVGLSRAFDYVTAYPNQHVLLVAVELCGLTFLRNDRSKSNIVATSLFADGAAAVLVSGEAVVSDKARNRNEPKIVRTMSTLFPDSIDVMGWKLQDEGLKVIFSRDIPTIVSEVAYPNLIEFLSQHMLDISEIEHFILHPGGKKVLDAYESAFHIGREKTEIAREVISEYGNMSSATVLFVLERFLAKGKAAEYGVLGALGPGFSSELLLLQW